MWRTEHSIDRPKSKALLTVGSEIELTRMAIRVTLSWKLLCKIKSIIPDAVANNRTWTKKLGIFCLQ